MSAAAALTRKIRDNIPLSQNMEFSIDALSLDSIEVSAPLEPNINIHGTGFAGSIYATGILTGWALATHIMDQLDMSADLVVGRAEIRYRAPITSDLLCHSRCDDAQRQQFLHGLRDNGKGKLSLEIDVGNRAALIQADFIAVAN